MEILSTEVVTQAGSVGGLSVILGILVALFGFVLIMGGLSSDEWIPVIIGALLMAVGIAGAVSLSDIGETKYEQRKVLIEDFNVVHEEGYEIVDQEGEIYTIRKERGDE
jgi:hypothetical protein